MTNTSELIEFFGGPSALAKTLGFDGKKGSDRVCNWVRRGIPQKILVENYRLFDLAKRKIEENKSKNSRE